MCLFPTRKACNDFNTQMLSYLPSDVHELVCTDEVDETAGTRKWNKKPADQLEKLNNDCYHAQEKFLLLCYLSKCCSYIYRVDHSFVYHWLTHRSVFIAAELHQLPLWYQDPTEVFPLTQNFPHQQSWFCACVDNRHVIYN